MRFATTLIAALALSAGSALAQAPVMPKPPTQADMQKMLDAQMQSMIGTMARMSEAMIDTQLNVAARPETAQRVAAFKKHLYDALLKSGFSQDQAVAIVVATPIPSAATAAK